MFVWYNEESREFSTKIEGKQGYMLRLLIPLHSVSNNIGWGYETNKEKYKDTAAKSESNLTIPLTKIEMKIVIENENNKDRKTHNINNRLVIEENSTRRLMKI